MPSFIPQPELRGVEAKRFSDRKADHSKHHPGRQAHHEGECAYDQDRKRLSMLAPLDGLLSQNVFYGGGLCRRQARTREMPNGAYKTWRLACQRVLSAA